MFTNQLSEGDIFVKFPDISISKAPAKTAIQQLVTDISSRATDSSKRLRVFMEKYEKEFKEELANKRLSFDITETEVLRMMKGPLTFYGLNMNGQVLLDLAGVLERYAIIYIEELFKSLRSVQLFPESKQAIEEILEKKFLEELTTPLITLGGGNPLDNDNIAYAVAGEGNPVSIKAKIKIEEYLREDVLFIKIYDMF